MAEKRYAIVKVNWRCPNKDNKEEIQDIFVCANRIDKRKQNHNCSDCLYGDTREQLFKKILTAIHTLTSNLNRGDTTFISHEQLADRILDFLGVK